MSEKPTAMERTTVIFRLVLGGVAVVASALIGVFMITSALEAVPSSAEAWARKGSAFLIGACLVLGAGTVYLRGWDRPLPWWVASLGLGGMMLGQWSSGGWAKITDNLVWVVVGVAIIVLAGLVLRLMAQREAARLKTRAKYWE